MENQRKSEENEMQLSRMQAAGCRSNGTVAAGHCALRNSLANFAMPIPISQCENFAMRNFAMPKSISQCQFQFRNAKISQCEISQCEISQCQSPFRIAKFTAFAKFTLRNFQALSSSVINAEPPSIFGLLLFCPIT